jgi:hypothetical protein
MIASQAPLEPLVEKAGGDELGNVNGKADEVSLGVDAARGLWRRG